MSNINTLKNDLDNVKAKMAEVNQLRLKIQALKTIKNTIETLNEIDKLESRLIEIQSDNYLNYFETEYNTTKTVIDANTVERIKQCLECNKQMKYTDYNMNTLVCSDCGTVEYLNFDASIKINNLSFYKPIYNIKSKLDAKAKQHSNLLTQNIQIQFIQLFNAIFHEYYKIRGKRKSQLNTNYLFFKFAQLTNNHQLLPIFPMLKTKASLKQHENIFKKLCDNLDLQFVRVPPEYIK